MTPPQWPAVAPVKTPRLTLEPLRVEHAEELADLLDDPGLHEFVGGAPATLDQLRARHARLVDGRSPEGDEGWLNWVIRIRDDGEVAGTVQATLRRRGAQVWADVAWVVASPYQGRGIATEASAAMVGWLQGQGVDEIAALIHPEHAASAHVARRLGLAPTEVLVDGEVRWVR